MLNVIYVECRKYANYMLSVITLNVVMLGVVAPFQLKPLIIGKPF